MEESQMGLFGEEVPAPQASPVPVPPAPAREKAVEAPRAGATAGNGKDPAERKEVAPRAKGGASQARKAVSEPATPVKKRLKSAQVEEGKKVSGLVPAGDVRLTANIREDLHLKLKIASARRRTTIGEILEDLIEKHI